MNPPVAASSTAVAVSTTDIGASVNMTDRVEPQTLPQSQLLSHPEPSSAQSQSHPHPQSEIQGSSAVMTSSTVNLATATSELPNALPQNPSPSTKLVPLRPRKIRKLSPDSATAVADGNSGISSSTDSAPIDAVTTTAAAKISSTMAIVPALPNSGAKPNSASSKSAKNKMVAAGSGHSRAHAAHHLPPRMVARSLSYQGEIERALRHLRNVDPQLAQIIDTHQPPTFDSFQTPFLALSKSILYQQLAYKAGTSIYARFVALCGGEDGVLPDTVLALTPQQLRQIGVSGRKASYLHDLARKYKNGILSDESIINMDDKSLFTMLTMVNGIGSWSVHMFMIFSLHRPDVLPVNDLGIRKGVQLLYGLEDLPRPSQMDQLCDKWRPYRSVASWYIWRFVEAKGTPSSAASVAAAGMSLEQQQHQEQQLHHHHHQHQLQHQQEHQLHHLQQQEHQLHHLQQQQERQLHQLQQQQQHQQQAPAQYIDPINGMINLEACAWGQCQ